MKPGTAAYPSMRSHVPRVDSTSDCDCIESPRSSGATGLLHAGCNLHIEVRLPLITHDVPLKAIERWVRTPSVSPKEEMGDGVVR
jgi:hypothetical protein